MFIPDADGDDVPDGEPTVRLDGWGSQDTHETLNSFIWCPDGWRYGCHGVFTISAVGKPGTPEADRTRINAGIWRYHPVLSPQSLMPENQLSQLSPAAARDLVAYLRHPSQVPLPGERPPPTAP